MKEDFGIINWVFIIIYKNLGLNVIYKIEILKKLNFKRQRIKRKK